MTPLTDTSRTARYTAVAIALHWAMAIGIFALATLGLIMVHVHLSLPRKFALYQLHKSIGITLLLLAVIRLLWRITHKPPGFPPSMPLHEQRAAHAGHAFLYLFLVGLPLSGWAMISASSLHIHTLLYSIVPWPDLPPFSTLTDKAPVEHVLKFIHRYGAWTLTLAVVGHAIAAMRHHISRKDDVLARMLPLVERRGIASLTAERPGVLDGGAQKN